MLLLPLGKVSRLLPAVLLLAAALPAQWRPPNPDQLLPPPRGDAPLLACTATELARLRAALAAGQRPVVARVDAARRRLTEAVTFPPRGGQHNQWYQCDKCQLALTTVDPTHHRCPKCAEVYSGPPYDDVVFARVHQQNLARALGAAWAFALTGDDRFAADAKAILLGYAGRYEAYPYHCNDRNPAKPSDSGGHLQAQTLTEAAAFVVSLAPAIDLVWPALTAAEQQQLLRHLVLPLLQNIGKCRRGKSNWQSWHNAAMFAGGLLLGDAAWLQRSVLDDKNGFCFQMQRCVSPEGMWYENSFGYHLYTLDALVHHAAMARRAGVDLFANPALAAMCALPARYVMADGRLPRLGDDVDSTPARAATAVEAAHAATRDPRLLALLPAATSWESLRYGRDVGQPGATEALGSEVLRHAGHAILRRHGPARATALMTFAPFGGFHGHFDKLAFVWHAFGSERGVDPGRARSQAYRLPIHTHWYRATLGHNAVVVDGRSQQGAGGELLGFTAGEGFDAVAAQATAAYRGVDHRRCLLLTDRYLVVLDLLRSDTEHSYDWLYHDRGNGAVTEATDQAVTQPLGLAGEEFVQWQRQGDSDETVAVRFPGDRVATRLWLAGGAPTMVRTGSGPFGSTVERAPLVLLRRRGTSVHFAAVLAAETAGHESDITAVQCREGAAGLSLSIERGEVTDIVTWDGAARFDRRIEDARHR